MGFGLILLGAMCSLIIALLVFRIVRGSRRRGPFTRRASCPQWKFAAWYEAYQNGLSGMAAFMVLGGGALFLAWALAPVLAFKMIVWFPVFLVSAAALFVGCFHISARSAATDEQAERYFTLSFFAFLAWPCCAVAAAFPWDEWTGVPLFGIFRHAPWEPQMAASWGWVSEQSRQLWLWLWDWIQGWGA